MKNQNKSRSITDFVSTVSHDLRNPLALIKAYAQLAKKRLQEVEDTKTLQYIEKIEQQTIRSTQLIDNLLNTSRISDGRIVLNKKSFRLDKLLKETVSDYQVTLTSHKLKVDCKDEVKVVADKDKIRRVIFNLLTNAVKYSPDANKIDVCISSDKQNVMILVKDYGIGIPLVKQKNLFDPYFRVKERNNQATGYGLGLPIVKSIIKAHNGKVWLESKRGIGSTFYFSLPRS